jgi:integrase
LLLLVKTRQNGPQVIKISGSRVRRIASLFFTLRHPNSGVWYPYVPNSEDTHFIEIDFSGKCRAAPGAAMDGGIRSERPAGYAKPRNRNWRETERILNREFVATHGQRDIRQIKRHDVLEIMDAALERGASYQANRILATIRKLFNWCLERGIIEATPIAGLKAPTRELSRDRVLDDSEIRRILNACPLDAYPFRQFTPLLLATAQRRGELANMRWSELDLEARTWLIPAERAKNGKPHVVHLSDFALSLLDEVPQFVDCDYVFTTTRRSPVSGFSKALRWVHEHSETSDWHMHDLRRTAASGMARAGVAPYVIEKVLNHVSGTISGVAAVYNRYGYDAERCAALDQWGETLASLAGNK